MFDLFRSRAKAVRYLLGAILMLVAISMVVTLIPGFGTGTGAQDQVVAEIGGEPLTLLEVNQAVQLQLRNRAFPSEMASIYAPQIIHQMIIDNAVAYEAQRLGFEVTRENLAEAIASILPQLFEGGKFVGTQVYASFLAQQNMTVPQFEENLRQQLLLNKLRSLVLEGIVVTPARVEEEYRRANEKVKIEYAVIDPAKYRPEVKVTPEEIQDYFNKNKASFRIPEKRSFQLLIVDEAQVAQSVTIPEPELRRAYEQAKDSFRTPERVKVRHILLKTTDVPKDQIPGITAKAEDLLKQIRQGADFAELARKNSQDPGSAAKGGDLGWIVRGQTVKPFEDTAFSMKPGQVSNVITTQYGVHIIQVLEKEDAHLKSFDEVKAQLADERKRQLVYDRMQNLADQARAGLLKNPQNAAQVARDLNLPLVNTARWSPGDPIPGLGANKDLEDAVASLRKGEVTPVFQAQPTKLAVAAVTDVFPARPAELSEVEPQIRQRLTDEKLKQLVDQRAKDALEKTKSLGGDLKKVAQSMGLEFKTPPEFGRNGAAEGLGSADYVQEAFAGNVGDVFQPRTPGDQAYIVRVAAKIPADMSQLAAQRENIQQQLKAEMASERNDLFGEGVLNRLIADGKVKIHQDVISRIVTSYSGR